MSIIIDKKYTILKKIGEGSFGNIFLGLNKITKEEVAIKIDNLNNMMLLNEAKIYNLLQNISGIPRIKQYGKHDKYNYLVIDLLDKSLEYYKNKYKILSLKTVICIGIQMFNRIRDIHNMNIVHRDIKPDNFMSNKNNNLIYLIDFGLSRLFIKNNKHIDNEVNKKIIGTSRYISVNIHKGNNASRRDDLESIIYILVYLLIEELPWQRFTNEENINEKILESKQNYDFRKVESIPKEFILIIGYIRELKFSEIPDYDYIINILFNLYTHKKYKLDNKYEWTI